MNPAGSKLDLRRDFLGRRTAIDAFLYHRWSWQICEKLLALPEVRSAETILSYWPLIDRREVDVRPLNRLLEAQSKLVALPVISRDGAKKQQAIMDARQFVNERQLVPGRWNLLEPVNGDHIPPEALDVVIVPALAIDERGNRLGYGKGYYDRFLRHTEAFSVGIIFNVCCAYLLPSGPHDFPLDARVSERSLMRFDHLQPDHR